MAITEVSICNGALTLIGADRIISLTQDTEEGKVCNERYPHVRDAVLQLHPWSFCVFRALLSESSQGPVYDYQYKYLLPTAPPCLMVLELWGDDDWVIEENYLLSNSVNPNIKYIGRVVDTSLYPPMVADLMSARLAFETAYKLTGSASMVSNMNVLYQQRLLETLSRETKMDHMPFINDDVYSDPWFSRRF